jgi:hypothetical protein
VSCSAGGGDGLVDVAGPRGGVPAGACLAAGIGLQRGDQGDAAGAGGEEFFCAGVAGIYGVLAGRQPGGVQTPGNPEGVPQSLFDGFVQAAWPTPRRG